MCHALRFIMGSCKSVFRPSFGARFMRVADNLEVTDLERAIIKDRYVEIVSEADADYNRTTALFIILSNLITIGGVLLISFLTLQKATNLSKDVTDIIFWINFVLSILVTVSNKTLYSFNIPRKYILNILTLEKYKSEGWTFVAGNGYYQHAKNMRERVKLFASRIEKIKIKSIALLTSVESSSVDKAQEGTSNNNGGVKIDPFGLYRTGTVAALPNVDKPTNKTEHHTIDIADDLNDTKNDYTNADLTGEIGSILAAGSNTIVNNSKGNTVIPMSAPRPSLEDPLKVVQ